MAIGQRHPVRERRWRERTGQLAIERARHSRVPPAPRTDASRHFMTGGASCGRATASPSSPHSLHHLLLPPFVPMTELPCRVDADTPPSLTLLNASIYYKGVSVKSAAGIAERGEGHVPATRRQPGETAAIFTRTVPNRAQLRVDPAQKSPFFGPFFRRKSRWRKCLTFYGGMPP